MALNDKCQKSTYRTWEAAQAEADRINETRVTLTRGTKLFPYKCPDGGHFHIGHRGRGGKGRL